MLLSRGARAWAFWLAVLVVATLVLHSAREQLEQVHVVLTLLLIVLGGSIAGGRALGLTLACLGFILIDYYFQPPYDTITVDKPLDWLVLIAFLATAAVSTQLLTRARNEADRARQRANEVTHLSRLASEALHAGAAQESLRAVAAVLRAPLGLDRCDILPWPEVLAEEATGGTSDAPLAREDRDLVRRVAEGGQPLVVGESGRVASGRLSGELLETLELPPIPVRIVALPLLVRGRTVGVMRLEATRPMQFDPAQTRFLAALSYYAALGVERVRLVAAAEREEALREADRLKDMLLASVSHDLRTPLTAIRALAEESAGRGDDNACAIVEQSERLNHMVTDLLDYSRLRASAFPVHAEINAAEDLIGAAIRQCRSLADHRVIDTEIDYDEPALIGHFDFVQSLRILGNLVENALWYSPADTPVTIRAVREGEKLVFSVADRGPGVPEADRERIFEPFTRSDGARVRQGGSGLGLSIARRLSEAQGGSLTYAPRPGGGSVFTLRLPAAAGGADVLPVHDEATNLAES